MYQFIDMKFFEVSATQSFFLLGRLYFIESPFNAIVPTFGLIESINVKSLFTQETVMNDRFLQKVRKYTIISCEFSEVETGA